MARAISAAHDAALDGASVDGQPSACRQRRTRRRMGASSAERHPGSPLPSRAAYRRIFAASAAGPYADGLRALRQFLGQLMKLATRRQATRGPEIGIGFCRRSLATRGQGRAPFEKACARYSVARFRRALAPVDLAAIILPLSAKGLLFDRYWIFAGARLAAPCWRRF